jgi:hypothetical protein
VSQHHAVYDLKVHGFHVPRKGQFERPDVASLEVTSKEVEAKVVGRERDQAVQGRVHNYESNSRRFYGLMVSHARHMLSTFISAACDCLDCYLLKLEPFCPRPIFSRI